MSSPRTTILWTSRNIWLPQIRRCENLSQSFLIWIEHGCELEPTVGSVLRWSQSWPDERDTGHGKWSGRYIGTHAQDNQDLDSDKHFFLHRDFCENEGAEWLIMELFEDEVSGPQWWMTIGQCSMVGSCNKYRPRRHYFEEVGPCGLSFMDEEVSVISPSEPKLSDTDTKFSKPMMRYCRIGRGSWPWGVVWCKYMVMDQWRSWGSLDVTHVWCERENTCRERALQLTNCAPHTDLAQRSVCAKKKSLKSIQIGCWIVTNLQGACHSCICFLCWAWEQDRTLGWVENSRSLWARKLRRLFFAWLVSRSILNRAWRWS